MKVDSAVRSLFAKINIINNTEPTRWMKAGLGDPQGDSVFTGRWKSDSEIGAQILFI